VVQRSTKDKDKDMQKNRNNITITVFPASAWELIREIARTSRRSEDAFEQVQSMERHGRVAITAEAWEALRAVLNGPRRREVYRVNNNEMRRVVIGAGGDVCTYRRIDIRNASVDSLLYGALSFCEQNP
jgi:hypothetical protein